MTTLREAATMALEAMLNFPDDISDEMFESITALKAALVEDAMQKFTDVNQELEAALAEPEPMQEPYCHVYEYDSVFGLHRDFYPREYNGRKPDRTVPLFSAPPQRPESWPERSET